MQAVVLEKFGGPEVLDNVQEVPVPRPGPGEVLVKVHACAVCYLDSIVRSGIRPGVDLPLILGHEIAGEVAEVGPAVGGLNEGQRVASTYRGVCGHCWYCKAERSALCLNVRAMGLDRNGGYAEYAVVPASSISPIPDGVPDDSATIAGCVLGAVWKGVIQKGKIRAGETVLVTGASGGAGIHSVQMAKLAGAKVLALTTSPAKSGAILAAGADAVLSGTPDEVLEQVREHTHGRGVNVVLECVGKATASLSLRALERGGRLVFIGELGVEPTGISVARMLYRETEIYGVASPSAGELAQVLDLIDAGKLRPEIGATLPLSEASQAHRLLADRSTAGAGRLVLHP
jgi:D-arabinose 1-dehydrogenase-like Zn-dependent alcohol dehydrogenase